MFPDHVLPALLGVVLGASAHRAGLCTVKAVAEVMTTGRAHVLWSFLKASIWTLAALSVASFLGADTGLSRRDVSFVGVAGGLVFGIGAALNGACSFSTLARLAEGHLVMTATLTGWVAGLLALRAVGADLPGPVASSPLSVWLVLPALGWIAWEGGRLLLRLARKGRGLFLDAHWPLSLGVLLLALANSGLLLMDRPWSFTSTAICATGAVGIAPCAHPATLGTVSATALLAMVASSVLRGSFRVRHIRPMSALRHLGSGALMGAGAAMIPGGNDGLILFGIPALSPHALPSWLAIVAGIWVTLAVMRATGRRIPQIRCENDICRVAV